MYVKLTAHGNIDHGQNPHAFIVNEDVEFIFTFTGASKACKDYIGKHNLGGGNWTGGQVFNDEDQQIARVSYNGRVWDMNDDEIGVRDE